MIVNCMPNSIAWSCVNVLAGIVLMGRSTTLPVGVMTGDASTPVKLLAHVVASPFLKITLRLMQLLLTHLHTPGHCKQNTRSCNWRRPRMLEAVLIYLYISSPSALQCSITKDSNNLQQRNYCAYYRLRRPQILCRSNVHDSN